MDGELKTHFDTNKIETQEKAEVISDQMIIFEKHLFTKTENILRRNWLLHTSSQLKIAPRICPRALGLIDAVNRALRQWSEVVKLQNYQFKSKSFRFSRYFGGGNNEGGKMLETSLNKNTAKSRF